MQKYDPMGAVLIQTPSLNIIILDINFQWIGEEIHSNQDTKANQESFLEEMTYEMKFVG